jgi:hypothetical protein
MFNLYIQNCHVILGPTIFSLPQSFEFFPQSHHEEKIRSKQQEDSFPQYGFVLSTMAMGCR